MSNVAEAARRWACRNLPTEDEVNEAVMRFALGWGADPIEVRLVIYDVDHAAHLLVLREASTGR